MDRRLTALQLPPYIALSLSRSPVERSAKNFFTKNSPVKYPKNARDLPKRWRQNFSEKIAKSHCPLYPKSREKRRTREKGANVTLHRIFRKKFFTKFFSKKSAEMLVRIEFFAKIFFKFFSKIFHKIFSVKSPEMLVCKNFFTIFFQKIFGSCYLSSFPHNFLT